MLISQIGGWTSAMWEPVINLFSFIPNWGWQIIVFTICLKLILIPLDFWQKKVARASAKKQAVLQPELIKIQKKFGNNKQMVNQKTMELYKRENVNMFGSCISMLVNMILTLFIFLTLFYGLMGISQSQIQKQYNLLEENYNTEFAAAYNLSGDDLEKQIKDKESKIWTMAYEKAKTELGEAEESKIYSKALEYYAQTIISGSEETGDLVKISDIQQKVLNKYNSEIKESWLWIDNVWRPDTNASGFPNYASYVSTTNFYDSTEYKNLLAINKETMDNDAAVKATQEYFQNKYNYVTYDVQQSYESWNGYFILVILAAVVTYLSTTISQMQSSKKKKKGAQEVENPVNSTKAMKIMKFILPIIMIIFTIGYSALFALYIVTNSIMATLISFVTLKIFEKQEAKQKITITTKNKPDYSR